MAQEPKQPGKECNVLADGPYCDQHTHLAGASAREYDSHRRKSDPFRRYYLTTRWRAVGLLVLARDIMCRMGKPCEGREFAPEVDQSVPVRLWVVNCGDFYDESNLQGLCSRAIRSRRQQGERRTQTVMLVRCAMGLGTGNPQSETPCRPTRPFKRVAATEKQFFLFAGCYWRATLRTCPQRRVGQQLAHSL
jgi:hypothetical protein